MGSVHGLTAPGQGVKGRQVPVFQAKGFNEIGGGSATKTNGFTFLPPGAVTTWAGDGTPGFLDNAIGTAARLNGPAGVAVDAAGNVYVADTTNNRIRWLLP